MTLNKLSSLDQDSATKTKAAMKTDDTMKNDAAIKTLEPMEAEENKFVDKIKAQPTNVGILQVPEEPKTLKLMRPS